MQTPDTDARGSEHQHTNRLVNETSPYLLQHAHNPVDWWPWSDEAFEQARRLDRPIFLSIGYSTCHWCHVMERESFENEKIAGYLNENFISIKVDREERPDIDAIYMDALIATSGSGGWPMSVFLDHDRRPFHLETYIPPEDRTGFAGQTTAGFMTVLAFLDDKWRNHREELLQRSTALTEVLTRRNATEGAGTSTSPGEEAQENAYRGLLAAFDSQNGGFGSSRKFPTPHNLNFLLRYAKRTGEKHALKMVEQTLTAIARGGVHDHIGGGFHRYSTDPKWLLPHFEKMLYDQAQLATAYLETYQVTGDELFAAAARDIFTYVLRDLADPAGGFWSAEDADSLNEDGEKEEGWFYLWSVRELKTVLGEADGAFMAETFNCSVEGNYLDEATHKRTGRNVLNLTKDILATDQYGKRIRTLLDRLYEAREKRAHPALDDKVITADNGLMLSALALGARVLGDQKYLDAAHSCAAFMLKTMRDDRGNLLRSYRKGKAAIPAFLDDYAFLALGLFDLYQTSFNTEHLRAAIELTDAMRELFEDSEQGGFFFSRQAQTGLIVRRKEIYDGAHPAGNSVAAELLLKLGALTGNDQYTQTAIRTFKTFSDQLRLGAANHTRMMVALDFAFSDVREVVISTPESGGDEPFLAELRSHFIPATVVVVRREGEAEEMARLVPFTAAQIPVDGKPTVFLCRGRTCDAPTTDLKEFAASLRQTLERE